MLAVAGACCAFDQQRCEGLVARNYNSSAARAGGRRCSIEFDFCWLVCCMPLAQLFAALICGSWLTNDRVVTHLVTSPTNI